jgi:peptide/nickel transport system permease protein
MRTYVIQRLLLLIPTLLGASMLVFVALRVAPGNIVDILVSSGGYASREDENKARERIAVELGLDKSVPVQYWNWITRVVRLDMGTSYRWEQPVWEIVRTRIPVSVELALLGMLVSLIIGIPAGILSAIRQDTWVDYAARVISLAGLSLPSFWLGMLVILLLVRAFNWIPSLTYISPTQDLGANLLIFAWPALTVGYRSAALIMRLTRSVLLEVMREDYIRTAWAKGLRESRVVTRHALRNAILPVVTLIGIEFAFLIGGLVVTEQVFNLPGIGRLLVEAIARRDYVIVQAEVMIIGVTVVLANLLVDLLYGWLDPRVRYGT